MRLRQNVASLHSLLASLGAKEEIWSVGNLARFPTKIVKTLLHVLFYLKSIFELKITRCLGDQLEGWTPARTRRKTAVNKVKLIFIKNRQQCEVYIKKKPPTS